MGKLLLLTVIITLCSSSFLKLEKIKAEAFNYLTPYMNPLSTCMFMRHQRQRKLGLERGRRMKDYFVLYSK